MIKHPDFPQWLETRTGRVCNDINNLSEQRFLTNRLSWAFDAGRNCVWDQFIEMKAERNALQDENKRLRDALKALMTNPSIDLGDMIYNVKDREGKGWEGPDVTAWGKALIEARKLLNL